MILNRSRMGYEAELRRGAKVVYEQKIDELARS